jgi:hypothetical protein
MHVIAMFHPSVMNIRAKDIIAASRPPDVRGRGDKYLGDIAAGLQRLLMKKQDEYVYDTCRVDFEQATEMAAILVEFAEDVHAEIGLWSAIEQAQQKYFGTPLPFLIEPSQDDTPLAPFDERRVQYLLWTLLPCLLDEVLLSPAHQDLQLMAGAVSRYLTERFAQMPKDSGVKKFLGTGNDRGWDIKRKLVWLGTQSYLFRLFCERYLDDNLEDEDDSEINAKDDFLCQECTSWSGMGVIDVLAGALDISEEDLRCLQSWHERHAAYYRVLGQEKTGAVTNVITARNVVNDVTYVIRVDMPNCPFQPGLLVFGSLVPWRGEWYWSGEQRSHGMAATNLDPQLRREMLQKSSRIAYRYCQPEAEIVRKQALDHHARFVAHYGGDLVAFPNGLDLAAAEQKRMQKEWAAAKPADVNRAMEKGGLSKPEPTMNYPSNFLKHEEGIGAFSDPLEGIDYLLSFNHVVSGLRKEGENLTEAEEQAVRNAVMSPVICPAFVRRLVAEHGAESIATAFLLRGQPAAAALEVLLRRYKGEHYRRRFPPISLVV